jgi:2-polyprenyl-3-methyl-5-hydroxy-6-metoxy-1,4-benzoquinol methylase
MQNMPWHHEWRSIDASSDPAWFIRFLDASRKPLIEAARANPAAVYPWARPGMKVLDVGCGAGHLLEPLALLLGESGHITGVDLSEVLIAEARRRWTKRGAQIDFQLGDATALSFGDALFDVVTANLLLQHLPDPSSAVAEMVRVLRPGGILLVTEQDWDSLLINHSDQDVTRRIIHNFCDVVTNGWMGRRVPALLARAGLRDVSFTGSYYTVAAADWLDPAMGFSQIASQACASGNISGDERTRWESEIADRLRDGTFHCGFVMFRASGIRPAKQ